MEAFKFPTDAVNPRIIKWEEFELEISRLQSLLSAFDEARKRKASLAQKIESLLQVRSGSLHQSNELEEMRKKLEARKLVMENLLMQFKTESEEIKNKRGQLLFGNRSLQVVWEALSKARAQLMEANTMLDGERDCVHLKNLQKMLRMRRKYMVEQVSALYPMKASLGQAPRKKINPCSNSTRSGDEGGSSATSSQTKNPRMSSLTILGLQLTVPSLEKISVFNDKEVLRSATALGYIAHVVLLIASYLDVPLWYPLRLGGSRSYIFDYAYSFEPMPIDEGSDSIFDITTRETKFPLFSDGQNATKVTNAIFLLSKDIEQLLNNVGIQSWEPRDVLANLKELISTIQSQEYIDS